MTQRQSVHHHRTSRLATAKEAAAYLRRSTNTLERWRRQGTGPVFFGGGVTGKRVFYAWSDLDAWLDGQLEGGKAAE